MTETAQQAYEALVQLPPEQQERFGSSLLMAIYEWQKLRDEIQVGLDQVERGEVAPMESTEDFLARMHKKHGIT